ncbi:MAG TPA: hypothetical protein VEW94_06575 [Chloroflexia bacterium]|nr:hypothetical protein [Chloroflexia bacterium]
MRRRESRDARALLLAALGRRLQRWGDLLIRQAGTRPQYKTARTRTGRAANPVAGAPGEEVEGTQPGDPPAHWLERAQSSGPPSHWLQRVREGAPGLLEGGGAVVSEGTAPARHAARQTARKRSPLSEVQPRPNLRVERHNAQPDGEPPTEYERRPGRGHSHVLSKRAEDHKGESQTAPGDVPQGMERERKGGHDVRPRQSDGTPGGKDLVSAPTPTSALFDQPVSQQVGGHGSASITRAPGVRLSTPPIGLETPPRYRISASPQPGMVRAGVDIPPRSVKNQATHQPRSDKHGDRTGWIETPGERKAASVIQPAQHYDITSAVKPPAPPRTLVGESKINTGAYRMNQEPIQVENRWPALPEEEFNEPGEDWEAMRREWERIQRLDREQRGQGWSA